MPGLRQLLNEVWGPLAKRQSLTSVPVLGLQDSLLMDSTLHTPRGQAGLTPAGSPPGLHHLSGQALLPFRTYVTLAHREAWLEPLLLRHPT